MKNENKINKAKSFCKEVKELALKYELPFFNNRWSECN